MRRNLTKAVKLSAFFHKCAFRNSGNSALLFHAIKTNFPVFYFSKLPFHEKLQMPLLSPTMKQGNIQKWNFKEGQQFLPGDMICEIETDKAVVGYEMLDEGFLAKIIIGDGVKNIPLGKVRFDGFW